MKSSRLLALCCALLLALTATPTLQAATITVTSAGDTDAVDGFVTLREAIYSANGNANWNADVVAVGVYGSDTIHFNIVGPGVHTITHDVSFPMITGPTVVDGYSQPGASPNTLTVGDNAVLLIELDGSSTHVGLEISSNNTVRGLVINRCAFEGIFLVNASNCVIEGNFIGTDPTGTLARGNRFFGVHDTGGSGNRIGGTVPAARNIISSNVNGGVNIESSGAVVRGNYIGTDKNGVAPLGNYHGIFVGAYGHNAIIGGSDADDGVTDGLVGARNVISGNGSKGILITTSNEGPLGAVTIMGNFIGLDASGSEALGNLEVAINNDGRNRTGITTIGGTAPGAGNVISANRYGGIFNGANGTVIQGNLIGTDASGRLNRGNGGTGIGSIDDGFNGASVVIGGSVPSARNVISGNGGGGLEIGGEGGTIQGNLIGTQIDGVSPLGNAESGVAIQNCSAMLGGLSASEGNTIAYNGYAGVFVYGVALQVSILRNSIFANGQLGIDLSLDGVTSNDAGDADTGPNNLQNFPVLTSVSSSGGSTTIAGTLNSVANATYRIEFFATPNVGQGQSFIGSTTAATDANGNASFNISVPQIAAGSRVTATATDPSGNTSEFAPIGQLANISTRLRVQTDENVVICGFILTGTDPKRVLIRGIGPSLAAFLPDFLTDPTIELHGPASFVTVTNDNWKTRPGGSSQQAEIEATGLQPTNDLESALVQSLPANNAAYTAILRGQSNTTGIGLIEAYDLDGAAVSKLANISTRGFVQAGDGVLIGGFITGNGPAKVIIRAIGPSLAAFGVAGALADPTLELHDGDGALLASNDNWRDDFQQEEIIATAMQPANDLESAIVVTLTPGAYTAIVAGTNSTTGVGLVEVYNIQ
jgi:parallel beta-helix repeat protein